MCDDLFARLQLAPTALPLDGAMRGPTLPLLSGGVDAVAAAEYYRLSRLAWLTPLFKSVIHAY